MIPLRSSFDMGTSKKLIRGLKDVSPLFGAGVAVREPLLARSAPELQVMAVSSPDYENDSLLLNTFFASEIAQQGKACSLVSILSRCSRSPREGLRLKQSENFGQHLKRHCLYWDELKELLRVPPPATHGGMLRSRDIFLDFEFRQLMQCEAAMGLLDKWVLLLRPTAESLTEGYKMMKLGLSLNPQLGFFIALEGKVEPSMGGMIFERFSGVVLKHLSLDLGWLGWVDLSDPDRCFSAMLHSDQLSFQPWNERPVLEKFALAGWVEARESEGMQKISEEVPQCF